MKCDNKNIKEVNSGRDWGLYMIIVGTIVLLWITVFCYGYSYFHPESDNAEQIELVEQKH